MPFIFDFEVFIWSKSVQFFNCSLIQTVMIDSIGGNSSIFMTVPPNIASGAEANLRIFC